VTLGAVLTLLTFLLAAGIYSALALKPLVYRQTLLVEFAAAFANRLLPAGVGGLGLHGLYLYKKRHSAPQATAVVSVNNLLGIVTHLALLSLLIVFRPSVLGKLQLHGATFHWWYCFVLAGVVLSVVALPRLRRSLSKFMHNLLLSLHLLRMRKLAIAIVFAAALTATYTLVLFCATHALGVRLGLLEIFVVFSFGMLAATATPTPGGLVGAEAGLLAGFVAYGMDAVPAVAAVLLYRLLTYWAPLLPGAVALLIARSRKLV
jgi:undecaprenyl-diphosphatase